MYAFGEARDSLIVGIVEVWAHLQGRTAAFKRVLWALAVVVGGTFLFVKVKLGC